ncbi:LysR family transcriptional regulator [Nocardia abscessus]|uniref:LysR family transcriptional regulator n=1 Tax=Nocardia abscessus TaxID=120957 RepID=UPI0024556781|nr:LysR family transcriptional regulator [Nocardia abscessus]
MDHRETIRRLDLNLLVSLDALLTERSVTRAAERLQLSQPALSASLARLRRHFDDPLLVRSGRHYTLSPLATRLRLQVENALDAAEEVFTSRATFDPAQCTRTFHLLVSDYAMAVLGGPLIAHLHRQAPSAKLRLDHGELRKIIDHPELLAEADGIVLPHGFLADTPYVDIFSDEWVCLLSAENTVLDDESSANRLQELPWVMTYRDAALSNAAFRHLQAIGVEVEPVLVVDSFLALPDLIAGSDRVAMIERRLARRMTALGDLRTVPCPRPIGPLNEALWWHSSHTHDPEHDWFRNLVADAAAAASTTST